MLLGAVGAYDWNGTVVMHTAGGTIVPEKTDFYNPNTEAGYEGLAGYLGELGHLLVNWINTEFTKWSTIYTCMQICLNL